MSQIKGPAIFLAPFIRDEPPYDNLENIGKWVAGLGYQAVQIPAWDSRVIDLDLAAESKDYCDDYQEKLRELGLVPTELAPFLQGQMLAVHPAYDVRFEAFHPPNVGGDTLVEWAAGELKKSVRASSNLGLRNIPVLSGGFAWHMVYPWPQRPAGVIDEAFAELARRWRPILDMAQDHGCVLGYELHPGSDVYDGATLEMFLEHTDQHPAVGVNYDPSHFVLQQLDYLQFIQIYGDRISGFHVKDAEFCPTVVWGSTGASGRRVTARSTFHACSRS